MALYIMIAWIKDWWFKFFPKKKEEPQVEADISKADETIQEQPKVSFAEELKEIFYKEVAVVESHIPLSVFDFPKEKYTAYWETVITPVETGHQAIVRFMSRMGQVLETHSVDGPTLSNVNKLVAKLVRDKMDSLYRKQ